MSETFLSQREIADALVPSGVRTMLGMQRSIQELVRPISGLNGDFGSAGLASKVGLEPFGLGSISVHT